MEDEVINALLFSSLLIVGLGLGLQVRNGLQARPCTFLWGATFLLLFVVMPLLTNLVYGPAMGVGWNPELITDPSVYLIYGVMTLAFSVGYVVTSLSWAGSPGRRSASARRPPATSHAEASSIEARMRTGIGLLVVAGGVAFLLGTGLRPTELLRAGRFAHYGAGTIQGPLLLLGQYLVGLIAVYAFYDAKHGFPNRRFSGLVYAVVLFMMVVGGGRKWLIFAASGWLAGVYDRRGRLPLDARVVGGFGLLVAVLVGWQAVRAVGWLDPQFVLSLREHLLQRLPSLLWEGDASHFFRASMEAIRANASDGLLYPFAVVRRIAFLPLPAEVTFGLKPAGIPQMFARDLSFYTAARMGNLPPGLYGLYVLSFGWKAALILGPILTYAGVRLADRFVMQADSWLRDVVFASFAMFVVLFMRGSEGGLYFMAFNVVTVGITRKLLLLMGGIETSRIAHEDA